MALPSLPDQVVALILDHLKHCCFRSDKERRDTGVSVSLVCTKWYVLGQRIAWYAITLDWTADERLVEGLLSRPEVLVKVARLSFTSQVPQPGEDLRPLDREAALKSVELVAACPQLRALDVGFPGQDGYLLDAIADRSAETTLDELKGGGVEGLLDGRDKLTSLRLSVDSGAPSFRLTSFVNLVQLDLLVENEDEGTAFWRLRPRIVSILLSAASLPFLASLSITARTSRSTVNTAPGYASPPRLEMSPKQLLDAIPFQIQHLSLDASCFLASDVVSYLLSPCRPPSLRSFRADGDTGVGLARLLRRTTGRYNELARALDQAGIAVTTMQ